MLVTSIFSFSRNDFKNTSFSGSLKVGIVLQNSKLKTFADNNFRYGKTGEMFNRYDKNGKT